MPELMKIRNNLHIAHTCMFMKENYSYAIKYCN